MNTGIIASRYATALLRLVDETGSGESVAAQVQVLENALDESLDFRRAVDDPAVSSQRKLSLFEAALVPAGEVADGAAQASSMAPELRKFILLLIRNGRIGYARLMFRTFISEYHRSRHIKCARLVVADPSLLSPSASVGSSAEVCGQAAGAAGKSESVRGQASGDSVLESRLRRLVEERTGCTLRMMTQVDPSLVGGFIFEVDGLLLDASVSRQIDVIRRQFIEKNRRIV